MGPPAPGRRLTVTLIPSESRLVSLMPSRKRPSLPAHPLPPGVMYHPEPPDGSGIVLAPGEAYGPLRPTGPGHPPNWRDLANPAIVQPVHPADPALETVCLALLREAWAEFGSILRATLVFYTGGAHLAAGADHVATLGGFTDHHADPAEVWIHLDGTRIAPGDLRFLVRHELAHVAIAAAGVPDGDDAEALADAFASGGLAAMPAALAELPRAARLLGAGGVRPPRRRGRPGRVTLDGHGIRLLDAAGATVLTSAGFSGSWADYIKDGLYDSTFMSATAGTVPNGHTSALPDWTVSRVGLTSLTAVANSAWPGGFYVEAVPSAMSDSVTFVSDMVPVEPLMSIALQTTAAFVFGGGISAMGVTLAVSFYAKDGTTLVSTVTRTNATVLQATSTGPMAYRSGAVAVPAGARFATLSITATEVVSHNAASRLRIGGGAFRLTDFGMTPYAFIAEGSFWLPWATTTNIPPGNTNLYPLHIDAPLEVEILNFVNADTAGARSCEFRLYYDPWGDATSSTGTSTQAQEVQGVNGSLSWTAAAKSLQQIQSTTLPWIILPPGSYWLAIRNTHATNGLLLTAEAQHLGITPSFGSGAVIAASGALGATLDFASITSQGTTIPAIWFTGGSLRQNWG